MAEESPFPSPETSPHSHKRRITDTHELPLNSLNPVPTLSLPSSSEAKPLILEVGLTETQKTDSSPEQSPKKAKLSLSEEGVMTDESLQDSVNFAEIEQSGVNSKELLNLDGKDELPQSDLGEIDEGSDEFNGVKDENSLENQSGEAESEVVQLESAKKGENFNGILQKLVKGEDSTSSLKIEMIDGTLLLGVGVPFVDDVTMTEAKRNRRNGKKSNARNNTGFVAADFNGGKRKCMYSRKDMEVMRYVNVKGQKKFWFEIYNGFSAAVKKEYDELVSFKNQQTGGGRKNCNNGGFLGTSCSHVPTFKNQGFLGESCSGNASYEAEIISSSNCTCERDHSGKDGDDLVGDWSEDEESDDEFEGIHRPAFKVEGEPDFESGPPEDGLEYLRRVRWEAKRIPKVKIAKLEIKIKDQSVYMPDIPDIEECPPHLVPQRPWVDEFIADFSKLRLALSSLQNTSDAVSADSESVIFARHELKSNASPNLASLKLTSGAPTLSAVLAMDPVTRVTMLRRRISLFESASDLSKEDCAWLFALCAVIETPLDADTCASLRCLLRSCAKLRAEKAEIDDEVIMLNVLATISGRVFGQSGN
ncbi:uncharacterized protein LOC110717630 [Chenopodium quinoa]|uniref:Gem-associated protein 2 n=1 Tax=Chenopodium quinoa TaxID=63459 RepID=A0A803KUA2_CHEQI|nr:uncharacterized protein LOC110717630 [Chenopodium quinoa]